MANFERPNIPYAPQEALPNNNRYGLKAAAGQPPSGDDFDGDFNYLIDAANDLYDEIEGVAAGIIPGANEGVNANKFPTTNGQNPPIISWTKVQAIHIDTGAVTNDKLYPSCVTVDKLADAAVQANKIYPGSVTAEKIQDGTIITTKLADQSVSTAKIVDGAIDVYKLADNAVQANKIYPGSITAEKLQDGSIITQKIADGQVTRSKLALVMQLPIGMIAMFPAIIIQQGWLVAAGQAVSRATYAALFGIIGTSYGAGDGQTTFNLPDYRGLTLVGFNPYAVGSQDGTASRVKTVIDGGTASGYQIGAGGGEEKHQLTSNEMPSHNHQYTDSNHVAVTAVLGGPHDMASGTQNLLTTSSGGNAAHNNMPPYVFTAVYIYAGA